MSSLGLPPLSLYIHIPWCVRKCPYCDFNSHQSKEDIPERAYVDALAADLEFDLPLVQGRPLQSIFFGGGTPSILSANAIDQILKNVQARVAFAPDIEITMEANPGTFEQEKFRGFRAAGVNRLSIGVQSFNPKHLEKLGRIHGRDEAINAVAMARKAGFDNINLDLMHGLPDQTVDDSKSDLTQAIALAPEHLSWYQLTIEQNTQFYSAPPLLPEDDVLADIQDAGIEILADAGYAQYEVSAYAKPNRQAKHNLNYWTFGDYLGIGAGAHGKITRPENNTITRWWKTRLPQHYLAAANKIPVAVEDHINAFIGGGETLSAEGLPLEFMMNALRLVGGVPADLFTARTGLSRDLFAAQWQELISQGLVTENPSALKTTALGQRFLNRVLSSFIDG